MRQAMVHALALALLVCAQRAAGARGSAAAGALPAPRRAHHSTPALRLRGGSAAADTVGAVDMAGTLLAALRPLGDPAA
jgi:hypothetical protein